MSKKKNKVRFGLKNAHYAKATFDEDGNVTYAKPVRLPGAVSLSMDPEGENENFYADDIVYFVINNNAGYEGDLELALIPEEFLKDILHEEEDANGVLAENANNTFERFALLFEFTGDAKAIRHVLYCCSASRPSMEGETKDAMQKFFDDSVAPFVTKDLPDAIQGLSDLLEANRSNFEEVDKQIADSISGS
jgi:phi13 family phage major tail protein